MISTNVKSTGIRRFKVDDTVLKVHDIGIEASLNDFGYSSIKGIPNPDIDAGEYKSKHGIYRESHYMYDVHFFLNSLRQYLRGERILSGGETIEFINRVLPPEYMGRDTQKVRDFRLRVSPTGHNRLPTFSQIFKDRYFSPYKEKTPELSKVLDIIGRAAPMKPKSIIVKHGGNPAPPKVSISKKGYVKIGTRKCDSYKKGELVKIANILNVPTKNKTISKICQDLKLKYVK